MSEIQFEFCGFSNDVISHLLEQQPFDGTVFIFPNENSRKMALRIYQQQWQFDDTRFLTIEELKDQLYLSKLRLLREEKRSLAFYAVLNSEDKTLFRVNSYFQSIELAHHFFSLWEEFNEECVPDVILDTLVEQNLVDLLDWQVNNFQQLCDIKSRYQSYLREKGFDDVIFVRKTDNLDTQFLNQYSRFVFANQFYYTNLEKHIIQTLQQLDKSLTLYYQLPEKLVDKESLEIKPFQLSDLMGNYATERIDIVECPNDFSMVLSMVKTVEEQGVHQIVDPAFNRNPYSGMLSPQMFNLGGMVPFTQSSVYRFFTQLYLIQDSVLYEEKQKKYLLPLSSVLSAMLAPEFANYFLAGEKDAERERILNVIYDLLDHEYKYIDIEYENNTFIKDPELTAFVKKLIDQLLVLRKLSCLKHWIDYIDSDSGISIKQLVSRQEAEHSNILDVFYRLLADLASIESIGIVTDWELYFNIQNPFTFDYKTSASLLRIMLDYMKAKTWQWFTVSDGPKVEITNLNDTRNIAYNTLAVMNVIEGKIPSKRQSPYLFTDKQRQHMGLKTYDDIRLREQYYFYRTVLASKQVYLSTQKNIENNIEISSFIEEIVLNFSAEICNNRQLPGIVYQPVYDTIFNNSEYKVNKERVYSLDFYQIPLDVNTDFPDHRLKLSYTFFRDLKTNPFLYYVRGYCRINEKPKTVERDFSPRLIGNIAHDVATECWKLLHPNSDDFFVFDEEVSRELVFKAIHNVIHWSKYYYSILHDYTFSYFEYITLPNLADGILGFFDLLMEQGLYGKSLQIMPEEEKGTLEEKKYKTFLQASENVLGIDIAFRGRADLRIFDPEEQVNYIIDFKTGQFEKEQLIIYELFYHLLQQPEDIEQIYSWFYQVLKKESKELREYINKRSRQKTKQDLIDVFLQDLIEMSSKLQEKGFCLADQKSKLLYMPEITRKDLYLAQNFIENGGE